jgi:hypothetical protein
LEENWNCQHLSKKDEGWKRGNIGGKLEAGNVAQRSETGTTNLDNNPDFRHGSWRKRYREPARIADNLEVCTILDDALIRPEDSWSLDMLKESIKSCPRIRGRQTDNRIHLCHLLGGRVLERKIEHKGVKSSSYTVYFYNPLFYAECKEVVVSKNMKGKDPRYPRPAIRNRNGSGRLRFSFGSLDSATYYIENVFMKSRVQDIEKELNVLRWGHNRLKEQFDKTCANNAELTWQLSRAHKMLSTLEEASKAQTASYNAQEKIGNLQDELLQVAAARDRALQAIHAIVGINLHMGSSVLPEQQQPHEWNW